MGGHPGNPGGVGKAHESLGGVRRGQEGPRKLGRGREGTQEVRVWSGIHRRSPGGVGRALRKSGKGWEGPGKSGRGREGPRKSRRGREGSVEHKEVREGSEGPSGNLGGDRRALLRSGMGQKGPPEVWAESGVPPEVREGSG